MSSRKSFAILLLTAALAVPALYIHFAGITLPPQQTALIAGLAILGASFLLLWACDAAQADISQTMALAVVALIAVLPEYAVDMYFTWMAGKHPLAPYSHYAIANMTGANRMLIGVAWAVIAVIFWFKTRRPVKIEEDRRLELIFLALATVYAFIIPIKGTLTWMDGVVLVTLYVWYIALGARRPCTETDVDGPAEAILALPTALRRAVTIGLFSYAAVAIGTNAGPFGEGLVGTGKLLHINDFLLVQWLAPIASEAPEFIVAISFAFRGKAGLALGSLLSAKLNQWTLLVGTIPAVYAVSSGTLAHPIPMASLQMHEILLTAAQSLLGVVILSTLRLSIWEALLLFTLFTGQFTAPGVISLFPHLLPGGFTGDRVHQVFSLLYVSSSFAILASSPHRLRLLWRGLKPSTRVFRPVPAGVRVPQCLDCPYRCAREDERTRSSQTVR